MILHLNEFLIGQIWYYEAYLINACKVWLLCIVHTKLSINGKKRVHVQNYPYAER